MTEPAVASTLEYTSTGSLRSKLPAAKWGAACAACATAKAKCIRSNPDVESKCDRCERLLKNCTKQVHRVRKKRQVKPSRTARIEERLDNLTNILQSSGDLSKAGIDRDTLRLALEGKSDTPEKFEASEGPWAVPELFNSHAPGTCLCRPITGEAPPPPDTDDNLLDLYRRELMPLNPFVVVPPTINAAGLAETKPFLMAAIKTVASFRSLRSMRAQTYYLMKHLSDHILIRSERSLDLLQGLIVIISWYQYHCFIHAQLSNLVGLATSLISDMGLTRPIYIPGQFDPNGPKAHTAEEKRAFAGVWFNASVVSIGFGRTDSLRFSKYLQQCLRDLEDANEEETDIDLVHLVRIQYLTDRINSLKEMDRADSILDNTPLHLMSKTTYINSYQTEINQMLERLPLRLKMNKIFMTNLHTATLRLYEPPDGSKIPSLAEPQSTDTSSSALEDIYQSRNALLAWFEHWLSVSVSSYYRQTLATCTQLIYAISMLGRYAKFINSKALKKGLGATSLGVGANNSQQGTTLCVEPQRSQSISGLTSPASTIAESPSSVEKEPCAFVPKRADEWSNPRIPDAVASLQERLDKEPGLEIDVTRILSTLRIRVQQVGNLLQQAAVPEETKDSNLWVTSALKILMIQEKLEYWANSVLQKTASLSLNDRPGDQAPDQFYQNGGNQYSQDMVDFGSSMAFQWTGDLMHSTENFGWLNDYGDWNIP
ncbi:unnamed protein product [Clonostachys byssicola]|uniref:Zn(2)-C6 fungal-type domain-containing protein n=1 Tax=Clonostachys byssicola TaxID=160290 RepID=A0A9N9UL81_9HYPO|nr:unnamed protein product [Clonostachys byssicola]